VCPERASKGYYFNPALFVETTPDMRINREEIFGPIASVIRVRDYEEALSVANGTPFGLCAGIATTSLNYATHFKRNAEAGMVMVNLPTPASIITSLSGVASRRVTAPANKDVMPLNFIRP